MLRFFSWFKKKTKNNFNRKDIPPVLSAEKFLELESLVGFRIDHKEFFIQALTHRSFLEQSEDYDVSNERLEFLGDSVLNLTAAEYLFEMFPAKDEGFLTKVRAKLVNRVALADAAEDINLKNYLLISKNISSSFAKGSQTILSDALEALIGAIYLDKGLESAKNFINKILIQPNLEDGVYLIDENYKSQLLEYAQAKKLENPYYKVVKEEGPQHNRVFTVKVFIGDEDYGIGTGKNKKSAEQKAAQQALENLKK